MGLSGAPMPPGTLATVQHPGPPNAETVLTSLARIYDPATLDGVAAELNASFPPPPTSFAQNNLTLPVPEPSSLLLLLPGLLALAWKKW